MILGTILHAPRSGPEAMRLQLIFWRHASMLRWGQHDLHTQGSGHHDSCLPSKP